MAEKRVIQLEVQDNVQSVKKQFAEAKKELQQMAAAYGENSVQAIQAAKRAAELKDIIDDSGEAIKNLQGGGAFQALGTSLTSTASGFSAVQGALGLVGVEGEKVQEALLKVQSAMALAEGLKGLEDAGRAFGALKGVVVDAFKNMSTASKAFAATGIGLIITGIALAIANMDKLKEMFSGVSQEQQTLNDVRTKAVEIASKELNALDKLKTVVNDESKSRKEKNQAVKDLQKEYPNLLRNLDAESISLKDLNKQIQLNAKLVQARAELEAINAVRADEFKKIQEEKVKALNAENVGIWDNVEAQFKNFEVTDLFYQSQDKHIKNARTAQKLANEDTKEEIKNTEKKIKFLDKEAASREKAIKKLLEQTGQTEEANRLAEDEAKKREEAENRARQAAEKAAQARVDALEKIKAAENEYLDSKLSADQLEIKRTEEKYNELIALAKKYGQDTALLEQARQDALFKIRQDALRKENEDMREDIDTLKKRLKVKKTVEGEKVNEMQKINDAGIAAYLAGKKKQDDEEKIIDDARKAREMQRLETTQTILNGIASLNELFAGKSKKSAERAFKVQKAVNIASALIDTYKSATAAYASQFVPAPDPSSPIRGAIAAAAAVAAGLANVKQIASQKFDGGGSIAASGGGAGSTGAPSITPSFNVVGQGSENPLQQFDAKQPLKAYVVSKEVTDQQNLDSQIQKNAQFG